MTLKDEMTGDKKLVYGKYGKFECTAYLERPFETTTRLVGMTLEFTDITGKKYQDGCMTTKLRKKTKFFDWATKKCPEFVSDTVHHTTEISFVVTEHFVGSLEYQCVLHTEHKSAETGKWISSAKRHSPSQIVVGKKGPQLNMSPALIRGVQGENRVVKCTADKGYPQGIVMIDIDTHESTEDAVVTKMMSPGEATVTIKLSATLNNKRLMCFDSVHPEVVAHSVPIEVTFMKAIRERIRVINVVQDSRINCANNIVSNGILQYAWNGSIISTSQSQMSRVDIPYSTLTAGGTQQISCTVKIVGDPLDNHLEFVYVLNYIEPVAGSSGQERSGSLDFTNTSVVFSMAAAGIFVLLLILMVGGYLAMRNKMTKIRNQHS